jgi:hypothetical protein
MAKVMAIIGWVVGVPVLALLWFVNYSTPDHVKERQAAAKSDRDFERAARVMCSSGVKEMLRNPSSVDWDGRATWPVIEDGENLYTVIAKYRAENGFGGMVQETRQCLVARSDDRATVLGIE